MSVTITFSSIKLTEKQLILFDIKGTISLFLIYVF